MRAGEAVAFQDISATTSPFVLNGGTYGVEATATWGGGTVTLARRSQDNVTFVTVLTFSANGYQTAQLPPGTYEITVATATAVYAEVQRIPGE